MRFRRARLQAPNSVSLFALTEFRGESSVSSSQPGLCVQNELTDFFAELTEFAAELSEFSLPKQYSRKSTPPVSYLPFFQDKFDHDKGQKSAISGRRPRWRLSTGVFAFSPVFMCNLVRRAPQNLEKVAKIQWRKSRQILSRLWQTVMVFSVLIFVPFSEVSKRGWREGVATSRAQNTAEKGPQHCVPLLIRGG